MRMHELACVRGFLYMYVGLILRTHSDLWKPKQGKFFVYMLKFGTNPTSSRNRAKPLFSHYKKPYIVYFQKT